MNNREETKNNLINEIKDLSHRSKEAHFILDLISLLKKLKEFDDIMTDKDRRGVLKVCNKYLK